MQTFPLNVPRDNTGASTTIDLATGQALFVLGANGTGKSSLLQRFAQAGQGRAKRISASRQTWLQSSALEFSPSQKEQIESQVRSWDTSQQSRWMEQNAQHRSGLTLYDLIDAENVDARAIASALRSGDRVKAEELARATAPLAKLNELFALSNIPIEISVEGGSRLVASKNGSEPYGAAELSDGERNALLIAADVLTAKPDSLLIIDEPERHLHRSIISPLLSQLFREQQNCAFVIATHDLMLPIDNPEARVLLVRSCSYSGSYAQSWDTDLLGANADIDEGLKEDIVGARRRIVFIEGEESSLDKPLYSIVFPDVSVRAKGSSRDVEHSVAGIRASETVHWVRAWGIIDNDGRDSGTVASLQANGIYALPFYSVESIYYHPMIINGVARRQSAVVGGDSEAKALFAINSAVAAIAPHVERMAARAVEKRIRRIVFSNLPTLSSVQQKQPVAVTIDTASIVASEVAALTAAINQSDWTYVLTKCPVRESPALDIVAKAIGLRDRYQYEGAVLQMLRDEPETLRGVRAFFGTLAAELGIVG